MFRRRGPARPLLGAAVLVGASRSAARHEVQRQGERTAQMQYAVEQEAARKRQEDEDRERRTQLAIDEAIAKERSRNEAASKEAAPEAPLAIADRGIQEPRGEMPPVYASYDDMKRAGGHFCRACGYKCRRDDRFCGQCGTKQPEEIEGIRPMA